MKKGLLICLTFFALMLSTKLSRAAGKTYTWTGTTSTQWDLATNWSSNGGSYPGSNAADIAIINLGTGNQPNLTTAGTLTFTSMTIGLSGSAVPTLTVGSGAAISLTGNITFVTGATANTSFTLAGAGTINVGGNIDITASSTAASYTLTLNSSITALNITGNIALTTAHSGSFNGNPTFNITGGTVSLTGKIATTEAAAGATATVSVASGATLKLANTTALSTLAANGTNALTFSSGSTVDYSGTAQTIYTSFGITGLAGGVSYSNLTLSGSGAKTTNGTIANNLNISGNFNNSTGSLQSMGATTAFTGAAPQSITLGSGVTFSNISFSGSDINTVSAGTMNITGNFTNSYTTNDASNYIDFTTNNTSVNFTGTGAQTIAGGSGTGTKFKTLGFSGGAFANPKTISSGTVSVVSTGTLTLGSGNTTLVTTGALVLESDANGSAQVAVIPSGSRVSGSNVKVQRYLTGGASYSRGWRLLSSPVYVVNTTVSPNINVTPNLTYVQSMVYSTGSNGSGGFDAIGTPSFYFYRENKSPDFSSFISGNFRGVNKINNANAYTFSFDGGDANASLPVGNGFLFFDRGDKATTTSPTSTASTAMATTLTATGNLNQGSIKVKLWFRTDSVLSYTSTSGAATGFNLVGNPYASSIDWDLVSKPTGLSTSIWIYNPKLRIYAVYTPGSGGTNFNGGSPNIIPTGQGFFCKGNTSLRGVNLYRIS